jgi:hypothetical protein
MTAEVEYKIIGCFTPKERRNADPEHVCDRIYEFLKQNNIDCRIHGSRVWAITVPPEKADEAAKLLKKSGLAGKIQISHKPPRKGILRALFRRKKVQD